ncbi:MAG: aminodeoxychorismate/anthranilate synthase component II [Candidatus Endonucleobacter bathymodioli]|uniref:Aminodeoxychorismate/anthranilate synthase component II n=1 Tax=Candidatus Endonucleibacter bathymodioli TaxID=539814 RepID=A0AA90NLE5_9GAMM|nr:aminodeoxychorismate/anthranilate synthase component II [Candidatus Endonucleobacter bathymodioli]
MLLVIDNYDSFTWNLVQYFGELGADVEVYRHDQITLANIEKLEPSHIVISPGPCTPNKAGISMDTIRHFQDKLPILGVCLGHQCIGQVYGGKVVRARQVMHGKVSPIFHGKKSVFRNIPNSFNSTRYHSLIIEKESLPDCLEITAWTQTEDGEKDEIMGIRHRELPVEGVQFHPESIMTECGHDLLNNFLTQ